MDSSVLGTISETGDEQWQPLVNRMCPQRRISAPMLKITRNELTNGIRSVNHATRHDCRKSRPLAAIVHFIFGLGVPREQPFAVMPLSKALGKTFSNEVRGGKWKANLVGIDHCAANGIGTAIVAALAELELSDTPGRSRRKEAASLTRQFHPDHPGGR